MIPRPLEILAALFYYKRLRQMGFHPVRAIFIGFIIFVFFVFLIAYISVL